DTYIKCSHCTAAYPIAAADLGDRGRRVRCSVCGHTWFQSVDRLLSLSNNFRMREFTEERRATALQNAGPTGDRERDGGGGGGQFGGASRPPPPPTGPRKRGEITVFVGNMPFGVFEQELEHIFGQFGEVASSTVVRDAQERSRGFGFVEMVRRADGEKAMEALNNLAMAGRTITVREGTSQKEPR
ncbi:unnamed protein product, partial [Phaeothamnion confervicola]